MRTRLLVVHKDGNQKKYSISTQLRRSTTCSIDGASKKCVNELLMRYMYKDRRMPRLAGVKPRNQQLSAGKEDGSATKLK